MYKTTTTCTRAKFTILVNSISDDPDNIVGGATYVHEQNQIHLSSELTIAGVHSAAEVHMVHYNESRERVSVLGTMIRPIRYPSIRVFHQEVALVERVGLPLN